MKFDTDSVTDRELSFIKKVCRYSSHKDALVQAVHVNYLHLKEEQDEKRLIDLDNAKFREAHPEIFKKVKTQ